MQLGCTKGTTVTCVTVNLRIDPTDREQGRYKHVLKPVVGPMLQASSVKQPPNARPRTLPCASAKSPLHHAASHPVSVYNQPSLVVGISPSAQCTLRNLLVVGAPEQLENLQGRRTDRLLQLSQSNWVTTLLHQPNH